MKYDVTLEVVKKLPFDTEKIIVSEDLDLFILRPSKLSKRFRDYDVEKNFQIWFRDGYRQFRPNHLRVMIDLNLRVRCRPDLKRKLLRAFDNIFYGANPDEEIKELSNEHFEHNLNSLRVIANLDQLFIIEQDYCYHRKSKFDPKNLFYQGWIRQMLDSPREIDNLCMSVAKGQPPLAKYTTKENKKHKDYMEQRKEFWYLE